MGQRGPKPKPANVEAAQGFPGRRKTRTKSVLDDQNEHDDSRNVRADSPPVPPIHLDKGEHTVWRRRFADPGFAARVKPSDLEFVARYCQKVARHAALKRQVGVRFTVTVTVGDGDNARDVERINPLYKLLCELETQIRQDERLLAATPYDRLGYSARQLAGAKDPDPPPPVAPADHAAKPADGSPIGILKSATPATPGAPGKSQSSSDPPLPIPHSERAKLN